MARYTFGAMSSNIKVDMILASNAKDRNAAVAVAVFKECKESLGEKVGTNSRPTTEERRAQMPVIELPDWATSRAEKAN